MKKYFVIIVLLCLNISILAQDTEEVGNKRQKSDLIIAFEKAFSKLENKRRTLDTEIIKHPGSLATVDTGFLEEEVLESFESVRNELLKSLDDKKYEGIKNQIAVSFPIPNLNFLGFKNTRIVVTDTSVENAFKEVSEYINELKEGTSGSLVNIKIIVNGGQESFATFKLGSEPAMTVTGVMPNIIRKSYYKYVISKPGFHDIFGELNLRRTTPTALECVMQEKSVPDSKLACTQIF